jgi:tetratricopeptide (TPR) repeat protein
MGKPPDTRLTPEVAREICERRGVKALVHGSIASLGSEFVITLEAMNAASGDLIAQEQAQAGTKEQVLDQLGKASSSLRSKLGESLASIQKFDAPLAEATTPSLAALKMESLASAKNNDGDFLGGVKLSQSALELDPNFAMAYRGLAVGYSNLGQNEKAFEYMRKAFALKDRASEREKLAIVSDYYSYNGQIGKSIEAYEAYKLAYPRDSRPLINQAGVYVQLGQYEKALANVMAAKDLEPDQYNPYALAAFAYVGLNRLDDAKAILNQAEQRKIGSAMLHEQLWFLARAQGDAATEAKEQVLVKANPQSAFDFLQMGAVMAASRGQMHLADESFKQAQGQAEQLGLGDSVVNIIAGQAMAEAMLEQSSQAIAHAEEALKRSQAPSLLLSVADVYARTGQDSKVEKLISQAVALRPDDEYLGQVIVPTVRAVVAMNHHSAADALNDLKVAEPFDRANTECLYTRASALLLAGRADDAAQEFERVLRMKNLNPGDMFVSLASLGLARSYALSGDKAKSRTSYQDFLAAWKDVDSDIPLVKQAQSEYAKLN